MKKILLFIESGGPGGAERVVLELAKGLIKAGNQVDVAGFRTGWFTKRLAKLNIKHIKVDSSSKIKLILSLKKLFNKYDIVHSHLLDSNFYCSIAAKLAKTNHVATEHGDVHHSNKKKLLKLKFKTISFLGSKICAVSTYTKSKIEELGLEGISVIGNPYTALKVSNTKEQVREKLKIRNSTWVWIHVANLRSVKDQATLIKALAKTKKNQKLLIAGSGELESELKALSVSLNVADKVIFLGHREDIGDLLNASDGFILCSLSEAMPMSLLEAGSFGLTLVGSKVGGIPEVITDEKLLFNVKDFDALSKIMDEQLKISSKDFIDNNFTNEVVVNKYLELY